MKFCQNKGSHESTNCINHNEHNQTTAFLELLQHVAATNATLEASVLSEYLQEFAAEQQDHIRYNTEVLKVLSRSVEALGYVRDVG